MNDLQIEYFLAAARNMSFSKAAQELFVSQPAISRQILALEQELGCPLFERLNRGIVLTGGGSLLSGLEELIEEKTGITTMIAEDPLTAVAIGTGKFIEFLHGEGSKNFD